MKVKTSTVMPTLENQTTFRKKAIDGPNSKEQA